MQIAMLDSFVTDQGEAGFWEPCRGPADSLSVYPRTPPEALLDRAAGCEVILTNKVRFSAEVLAKLPQLRYLGICATGTNNVDLEAARERGVVVTNVPGYSTDSVAQFVLAYLLERACALREHDRLVKHGGWQRDFCVLAAPIRELRGTTLCIIGLGAIGRAVARLAEAFGIRVLAAAVPGSSSSDRLPLPEALAEADAVTLHCPLTPATEALVNDQFLAGLKPGAILINTGRGPLIDEAALVRALNDGRLAAFCGDVLAVEPPAPAHPLCDPAWGDRVLLTPHVAWATIESRRRLRDAVAANLATWRTSLAAPSSL